ncbi:NADH-dependent flavin oxidoreductase [Knufia peltigerae]|uniref:NADH-dependent flavin oxidoreductase n=1 Tax=Knufia peltigerae TaxID=1002370 RepID=A0AA39CVN4_9EURO|nr:NADH-dependent flavin oxidoreductase [Knufia peltigerae]
MTEATLVPDLPNKGVEGLSYFTPAQDPVAGSTKTHTTQDDDVSVVPKLFEPLKIRHVEFQNRIFVSPMCQYSAQDGHLTHWHLSHLGGILMRGPGLTMIEATAVLANGRITPQDSGLWQDSQMGPLKMIVDFAHSQGQKIGIQLSHAGRKASTVAPWLAGASLATENVGGWPSDVWGPSDVAFTDTMAKPICMGKAEMEELKEGWAAATRRAVQVGFDVIEVHAAHGYLLSSFHSPAVNDKRTDEYGGPPLENRTRLTREIVQVTRKNMPETMPLFVRVTATDWLEENPDFAESWTPDQTVELAASLTGLGVDLIDVSSGGNHVLQHIHSRPGFQAPFATMIKKRLGHDMLVATVGMINEGKLANKLLQEDELDAVFVGRAFLKNPGLVWAWADELGTKVAQAHQIAWGFSGRKMPGRN